MIVSQTDAGWTISLSSPPTSHADGSRTVLHAAEARLRDLNVPADGSGPLLSLANGSLRTGDGWDLLSLPQRAALLDFVINRATLLLLILNTRFSRA